MNKELDDILSHNTLQNEQISKSKDLHNNFFNKRG